MRGRERGWKIDRGWRMKYEGRGILTEKYKDIIEGGPNIVIEKKIKEGPS